MYESKRLLLEEGVKLKKAIDSIRYKSDVALVKDEVVGKLVGEYEKLQERLKY